VTWEEELFALLDDLEGQAEAQFAADLDAELADRSRAEYRQVTFASRLMASLGRTVTVSVAGVGSVSGRLDRVADGWCLVSGAGQDWVVRLGALTVAEGVAERSVPEVAWSPLARLGLGSALRRIADSGDRCVVHLASGERYEGRLRRVGADFVELLTGADRLVLVPFAGLAAVQRRD